VELSLASTIQHNKCNALLETEQRMWWNRYLPNVKIPSFSNTNTNAQGLLWS